MVEVAVVVVISVASISIFVFISVFVFISIFDFEFINAFISFHLRSSVVPLQLPFSESRYGAIHPEVPQRGIEGCVLCFSAVHLSLCPPFFSLYSVLRF